MAREGILAAIRTIRRYGIVASILMASVQGVAPAAYAQEPPTRDTSASPRRTIRFETTEGTAMNVDVSPDGKTIVFDLLGDIYLVGVNGGVATRLTHGPAFDAEPSFSPDGKQIVFVSDRSGIENLWLMDVDGGHLHALTKETTVAVTEPHWLPDGDYALIARKGQDYWLYGTDGQGAAWNTAVPAGKELSRSANLAVTAAPSVLYSVGDGTVQRMPLKNGSLDVLAQKTIGSSEETSGRPAVSPDGHWVVYKKKSLEKTGLRLINTATRQERWLIYPLPDQDYVPSRRYGAPPVMTRFAFTPDGKSVVLGTGGTLQRITLDSGVLQPIHFRATVEQEIVDRAAGPSAPFRDSIALARPFVESTGSMAFEGATVITMRGTEVLTDATVLVTGRRIAAVGPRGRVALLAGTRRIDVRGKTIIPGLIDAYAMLDLAKDTLTSTAVALAANLSFGVTTVRALATGEGKPDDVLSTGAHYADRLAAGAAIGARLITVGAVTAAQGTQLTSPGAARALVGRQHALGATAIVPRTPLTRQQRQWLARAAADEGVTLIGESGALGPALTMAVDGYATLQSTIPNAQLYSDVRAFFAAVHPFYVPSLVDARGGIWKEYATGTAEDYFLARDDLRDDAKLQRFGLEKIGPVTWRIPEYYHFLATGRQAVRLGAPLVIGTEGKRPGLGVHWELWALAQSGLSAHDALQAATRTAAEALGLSRELGTVEAGKIADLVVLDSNPLTKLEHSRTTRYVMRDGVLFDAATLAGVWPRVTPPPTLRDTRYDPPAGAPQQVRRPVDTSKVEVRAFDPSAANVPPSADRLPVRPARTVSFETTQGTFMNLDLSPDGRTLVFDLLGDLYTMPATGGAAVQLTRGLAYDRHPVWSPDGKQIAYISDGTGMEQLWVVDADGTHPRPVTEAKDSAEVVQNRLGYHRFTWVEWMPDGQFLVSGDTIYHVAGGAARLHLANPAPSKGLGHAPEERTLQFSADGRYIYFPTAGVQQYDRTTGTVSPLAQPPVELLRPRVSPDRRWLVYVTTENPDSSRRRGGANGLRVRNLETGDDRWLAYPIDQRRTNYERYVFTPDSRAVLIMYGGQLHRIDVEMGRDTVLPFHAKVQVDLGPWAYHQSRVTNDSVSVRSIRSPARSPDGKTLAFAALQHLYTMTVPGGAPTRLVPSQDEAQFQAVYSPDGKWIAYVTATDTAGGYLWRVPAAGGTPERLTSVVGTYVRPTWSPDGAMIVVSYRGGQYLDQKGVTLEWLPSAGGAAHRIVGDVDPDSHVTISADGERVFFVSSETQLCSVRLDGTARRTIARFARTMGVAAPAVVSPDGRHIAYLLHSDLFLARVPETRDTLTLGDVTGAASVLRLSHGALDPRWESGGPFLTWAVANQVYRIDPDRLLSATAGMASIQRRQEEADVIRHGRLSSDELVTIHLMAPRGIAHGTIALRGARIITMKGEEVFPNGTIVIVDDRIAAIGPTGNVAVPAQARVIDVQGKTIIPGLIDLHQHFDTFPRDNLMQQQWSYLATLAYGVTTARDPSDDWYRYGMAERLETGAMVGPRMFNVGWVLTPGAVKIESLDDARAAVGARVAMGSRVVKQYTQPSRLQRQWVLMAAQELGVNVTNEGAWESTYDLTMVLDGFAGVEHNMPEANIYSDVTRLIAASRTWITPTMMVVGPRPAYGTAESYFRDQYRLGDDLKAQRFMPDGLHLNWLNSGYRQREGDIHFVDVSKRLAEVTHAGGHVGVGGHGQQHGIGTHWEMWGLQMGGLTNHEALHLVTLGGAEALGMQEDLGSLEQGKIADLIVLDRNPLADIRNTAAIRYVMKNGVLYDGNTLATIWPVAKPLPAWRFRDSVKGGDVWP